MLAWWRRRVARVRGLVSRAPEESDLDQELEAHLAALAEAHQRQGLSVEKAHRAARREFGGLLQVKEACRDQRGLPAFDDLWRDLCVAGRTLRRAPGFAVTASATLALGIASTIVVFSWVTAVLSAAAPIPTASQVD